jgi:beta-lactamase class A
MQRRQVAGAGGLFLLSGLGIGCAHSRDPGRQALFDERVRAIESRSGGRLGVAIRDSSSGAEYAHRGDERFAMCSTFKMLAAGFVLARVDRGTEQLARQVVIQPSDLVPYAPAVQPRVGGPISVAELCEAAVALSDNAAANLLLRSFGGPPALTTYLRSIGDEVTRLDRYEPFLNEVPPGDARDTTSPRAMLATMHKLVLGDALSRPSREQLTRWLLGNKVGDTRLRAQLPPGWRVADKTGTGPNGTHNDAGVLFPPRRAPVLVAAYLTGSTAEPAARDRALAEVGRLAAELVA